ncbi:UDP-N-acetylmuramate dehydrogenase [Intestinirhabdus alba]|jgi:UDP-N-acetylmuramate dehydrogenase|uniref:UDP-N-acetylenolpyruvoylglucosamine reductase n=1 Tax=Intestinirhabdus alba TaxID=2899544 RepID=A0A6L6ISG3_9ENTR|nr:UDP-N-acetylmuramate dehydrogenase [Intestinirhabdus alba]MTH48897.1 UDP-N-acetylmuramate dehydrogenase [Intestinirhabdus alba]
MSHSLKPWNTFGIEQSAHNIVCAETEQQLLEAWQSANALRQPVLILGEGSNVLFLESYNGTVIANRIKGIQVTEKTEAWLLHVGAGENWHQFVEYTLRHNMPGLENLAMIPGCVGSSPIQNIGAYGVELQRVCDYVDCLELATGKRQRLTAEECRFGYRDSIFKHQYQDRFAIVAVGFCLPKRWQPVLSYGDLARLNPVTVTPQQVFDAVCHMRTTKLPDPKINGNAGSFFKNPVVTAEKLHSLLARFPNVPHYPQADGSVKLAAGWLIDQCQLKGAIIGGAAVHLHQALVLINVSNATSKDVVQLARHVRQKVGKKFNVWLEPEVRFIGQTGEVDGVEIVA